tara:strand:+ start:347 stop:709 length:363 start_codon:yes stop_codon:yes gene_type:complete
MKTIITSLLLLISVHSQAQAVMTDPYMIELEMQRSEIESINLRINNGYDLIDTHRKQKNASIAVALIGTLVSVLMVDQSDWAGDGFRKAGITVGLVSVGTSIYYGIKSNKTLKKIVHYKL